MPQDINHRVLHAMLVVAERMAQKAERVPSVPMPACQCGRVIKLGAVAPWTCGGPGCAPSGVTTCP